MDIEAACPSADSRRSAEPGRAAAGEGSQIGTIPRPRSTVWARRRRGGDGECDDHISRLPDSVLGDIVSLLPTRDAARTQVLASRWRRVWSAAPLNVDLPEHLSGVLSRILSAHRGPARRLRVPALYLHGPPEAATLDAWLRSPALDNLREIEFYVRPFSFPGATPPLPPPASLFRFSSTLRAATLSECRLPDGAVEALRFPRLRRLALVEVDISERALQGMVAAGCPALECLLLDVFSGFPCLRISSRSLRSIGVGVGSGQLVIEDAPLLQRLIHLSKCMGLCVSVISAPKLETLRSVFNYTSPSRFVFGGTVIQKFILSVFIHTYIHGLMLCSTLDEGMAFTTVVCTIKILAIDMFDDSLDVFIDLLRCFPCLERLYIESCLPKSNELCHHKHREPISCLDIHIKSVVLGCYRGFKSQVNFATFFIVNARVLESMRFDGGPCNDDTDFIAAQHSLLQLDKRASRDAQFYFASHRCCEDISYIKHVNDLALTDPFKCRH